MLLLCQVCVKHSTHIISCTLQDYSVQQGAIILSILQRRNLRPTWAHSPSWEGWRSSLISGSLTSLPSSSPSRSCFPISYPQLRKTLRQCEILVHSWGSHGELHFRIGVQKIPRPLEEVGWELHTQESLMQNKTVRVSQTMEKLPGEGET